MPTFQYDGSTVHYGDSGSGDPLLLLHSGGSSGSQWRKVGEHLTGRRLLTPDFYGYGGTDAWSEPRKLQHDDQAELVAAILQDTSLATEQVDKAYKLFIRKQIIYAFSVA